jgi:hypothetical protein
VNRKLELALIVLALIGLPIAAGVIAATGRSAPHTTSAFASFAPLVRELGYTPTSCEWTQGHGNASCTLRGGGSCSFAVSSHTGSCTTKSGGDDFLVWADSP